MFASSLTLAVPQPSPCPMAHSFPAAFFGLVDPEEPNFQASSSKIISGQPIFRSPPLYSIYVVFDP